MTPLTIRSVWLIEDNIAFRDSIRDLLSASGTMTCPVAVPSWEAGLAAMDSGDVPDVVLMDLRLEGGDGIEGVRRFKAASPSTPVIMLTSFDDDGSVFQAICAGANGYLLKDAPGSAIIAAIDDVLNGGAPMNGQVARKVLEMFSRFAVPQAEYGLSKREKEILQMLVDGLTTRQIAERLFLSFHTIDTHLKNIYAKLQVHSRSSAVAKALKERLL